MTTFGRFLASAKLIAVLTLVSRVFGLAREFVFSYYFGTSGLMSSFRIAFMAPNLARRLFGEGALSSSMIPILSDTLHTRGEEASRRFVGSLFSLVAVILVAGVLAAEVLIYAWRTVADDRALELAAVLMPYMAMICLVAVGGGVLNVRGHFATPAAVPVLLNAINIVGLVVGAEGAGLTGIELMYVLCASVLVAGVGQLVATAVALRGLQFLPLVGGSWRDPQIRRVFTLMAPMALGLSVVQINSLMDFVIAYFFVRRNGEPIGPAVLGYAQYLYQLPLGVFGIALATAIFPILSKKAAEGDASGLAETVQRGVRLGLFIALPATVGLIAVAFPLVRTLYERGEFSPADTPRVAGAVMFYSLGMTAYFAQHVVVRSFYALHDSRTPARVAMWMVAVNFVMNLCLVFMMEESGLALATALSAGIQVVWLARRLSQILPALVWHRVMRAAGKMVLAAAAMGLALQAPYFIAPIRAAYFAHPLLETSSLVAVGIAVYVAAARLLHIQELRSLMRMRKSATAAGPPPSPLPT